jgi:hypothetical protein
VRTGLLLLTRALTACAPGMTQVTQAPVRPQAAAVTVTPPVPVIVPGTVEPEAPLTITDASAVTVTLAHNILTIALNPDVPGIWLRLTLADGRGSPITDNGPCHCIGLGGSGTSQLALSNPVGLTVLTSVNLNGPYTEAAHTR